MDEPEREVFSEPSRAPRVYGQMPHVFLNVRVRVAAILGRARSLHAYAVAWVGTRAVTIRRVAWLRSRSRQLLQERRRLQLDLGAAAYAEDSARTRELRERMGAVDATLVAIAADESRTREGARDHLARERLAIQRTEINRTVG